MKWSDVGIFVENQSLYIVSDGNKLTYELVCDFSDMENDRFMFEVGLSLKRYCVKDFGNLSEEDIQANEESLKNPDNLYLLGLYQTCVGEICVITNASEKEGENITTLLFPKER